MQGAEQHTANHYYYPMMGRVSSVPPTAAGVVVFFSLWKKAGRPASLLPGLVASGAHAAPIQWDCGPCGIGLRGLCTGWVVHATPLSLPVFHARPERVLLPRARGGGRAAAECERIYDDDALHSSVAGRGPGTIPGSGASLSILPSLPPRAAASPLDAALLSRLVSGCRRELVASARSSGWG